MVLATPSGAGMVGVSLVSMRWFSRVFAASAWPFVGAVVGVGFGGSAGAKPAGVVVTGAAISASGALAVTGSDCDSVVAARSFVGGLSIKLSKLTWPDCCSGSELVRLAV